MNDIFFFESDISYRTDKDNIKSLGRCNFYNSSKFYGSISSKEVELGYATAIFETSKLLRDDIDGYEIYTVGMWTANEDIELMGVKPPAGQDKESEVYKELREVYEEDFKKNGINDDQKEFYELYGKEMTKNVKTNENDKYCISALITETLLHAQTGIVYPSVQAESKGLNVVLNPMNFDNHFTLKRVMVADFFKFKKESIFRNLFICEDASVYPFKYKEVDGKSSINMSQVVDFFNQRGIPSDYIIGRLVAQLGMKK